MYFREYDSNEATLKEWARQLNIISNGNFMTFPTVESTLNHWKNILNEVTETNIFDLNNSSESTIKNWKDNLNNLYNE